MPGLITHLEIANNIGKKLKTGIIKNRALFYIGSIAPDAVHSKEDYQRIHKKKSHLRQEIADVDFNNISNLELFYSRVEKFINNNIFKESKFNDLYKGYVVHLLTDELFLLKLRPKFVEKMQAIDITPRNIEFKERILYELDCHNFMFLENNRKYNEIFKLIKNVKVLDIEDYILENEVYKEIDWMVNYYNPQKINRKEPKYIFNKEIKEFSNFATDNIIERLSDNKSFSKIF